MAAGVRALVASVSGADDAVPVGRPSCCLLRQGPVLASLARIPPGASRGGPSAQPARMHLAWYMTLRPVGSTRHMVVPGHARAGAHAHATRRGVTHTVGILLSTIIIFINVQCQ